MTTFIEFLFMVTPSSCEPSRALTAAYVLLTGDLISNAINSVVNHKALPWPLGCGIGSPLSRRMSSRNVR